MSEAANRQLGDYRILEPIGCGGMGEVFLAEHVHLRKKYALKVLPQALARDKGFVARFHDEARVMAELRHPHIVEVQYMGHADGVYFLVMDYVTGPQGVPASLHDYLRLQTDRRIPERQVAAWAIQIAEALAYAHQRGVVHRDVKPANILLDVDGNVKLTDFGLAKAIGSEFILSRIHQTMQQTLSVQPTLAAGARPTDQSLDAHQTLRPVDTLDAGATQQAAGDPPSRRSSSATSILGTYDYMSPEQRGEGGLVDHRSDIYSFGVLLFRLLTGRRPVGVGRPSELAPGISTRWDRLITRCLAYDQKDRYGSVQQVLVDLRAMAKRPGRRRLITGVACLAIVAAGAGVWMWQQPTHTAVTPVEKRSVSSGDQPTLPADAARQPAPPAPPTTQPPALPPVTMAEAVESTSRAQVEWAKVENLDRGQGFGERLDTGRTAVNSLNTFMTLREYAEARNAAEKLVQLARELQARDQERRAANQAASEADQARQQAAQADAEREAATLWTQATTSHEEGRKAFDAADFTAAVDRWSKARDTFEQARGQAREAQLLAQQRRAATQAAADADEARQQAAQAGASSEAATLWTQAVQSHEAARKASEAGDLTAATDQWSVAKRVYNEARDKARAAVAAREMQKAKDALAKAQGEYTSALAGHDAERLKQYGGEDWAGVVTQVTLAESETKAGRFDAAAQVYRQAVQLLPQAARAATEGYTRTQFDGHMAAARKIAGDAGLAGAPPGDVSQEQERRAKEALARVEQALAIRSDDASARQLKTELQRWRATPRQLTLDLGGGVTMELMLIPAGEFMMGSPDDEEARDADEGPRHRVRISKPFYLGKHEVTVNQFRRFVEDSGYRTDAEKGGQAFEDGKKGGYTLINNQSQWGWREDANWRSAGFNQGPDHPVVLVSWNDAKAFCDWLGRRTGRTVRLPTEAEWEYAARGGDGRVFPWGNIWPPSGQAGNYADDTAKDRFSGWQVIQGYRDGHAVTAPVGSFAPNPFGVYDLGGNVWEWCADRYGEKYYAESPGADPQGPGSGEGRVVRGGSWDGNGRRDLRSAYRNGGRPDNRHYVIGLRVVGPVSAAGK